MTSTGIYSTKVLPYVYMGTHKTTGQYYIGVRYANTKRRKALPSHLDILQYRTSSRVVKPIFDEFDWVIVAEFFDKDAACDFEIQLIEEHWGDPLLLNKSHRPVGSVVFRTDYEHQTEEESKVHRAKIAKATQRNWDNKTEEDRKKFAESTSRTTKLMWEARTEEERIKAVKKASAWHKTPKARTVYDKIAKTMGMPCEIDGVRYESRNIAAAALGIRVCVIRARLRSNDFPTYICLSS